MRYEELPKDITHDFEFAKEVQPTKSWYIINMTIADAKLLMIDSESGEEQFGDEWKDIITGRHPEVRVEEIKFTVH